MTPSSHTTQHNSTSLLHILLYQLPDLALAISHLAITIQYAHHSVVRLIHIVRLRLAPPRFAFAFISIDSLAGKCFSHRLSRSAKHVSRRLYTQTPLRTPSRLFSGTPSTHLEISVPSLVELLTVAFRPRPDRSGIWISSTSRWVTQLGIAGIRCFIPLVRGEG